MVDNAMLETFRGELLDVQKILDGCTFVDLTDAKKELQAALTGMESPLQVMVMGAFSTGKSSFINALLGESVTAVGALPTTAVITKLVYGDGKAVTVYFQDETSKSYSNEEFMRITDENDATWASTRERISYVERSLPLEVLKDINIIDSPGLEAKEIHTIITKKFVNHADVVFWMFSAENAGTGTEIKALEKLNSRLKPIAIINKMDTLDEEEDDPEEFLQDMQHKLEGKVHRIIGISAKMALDGRTFGNNQLLLESNIGEVEKVIEEIVVPETNQYKVNTLMDRTAACLVVMIFAREDLKRYKKYAEIMEIRKVEGKLYGDILDTIDPFWQYAIEESRSGNAAACVFVASIFYSTPRWKDDLELIIGALSGAALGNSWLGQGLLAMCCDYKGEKEEAEYWAEIVNDSFTRNVDIIGVLAYAQNILAEASIAQGNHAKGCYWYEQSLNNGYYPAGTALGDIYTSGKGVDRDIEKGIKYYNIAAEHNDANAQFWLGWMYARGLGISANRELGLKWLRAASENNIAAAQYELYELYATGEYIVAKDYAEAIKWLRLAAEDDDEFGLKAKVELLNVYSGMFAGADELNEEYLDELKAVTLGEQIWEAYKNTEAIKKYICSIAINMGSDYYVGGHGLTRNPQKAVYWFEMIAKEGDDFSQHRLGVAYLKGDGVPLDYNKARYWFEKAAAQGNKRAIRDLGYLSELENQDNNDDKDSGVPNNGGCLVWLTFPFGLAGFLYYWLA